MWNGWPQPWSGSQPTCAGCVPNTQRARQGRSGRTGDSPSNTNASENSTSPPGSMISGVLVSSLAEQCLQFRVARLGSTACLDFGCSNGLGGVSAGSGGFGVCVWCHRWRPWRSVRRPLQAGSERGLRARCGRAQVRRCGEIVSEPREPPLDLVESESATTAMAKRHSCQWLSPRFLRGIRGIQRSRH